MNKSKAKSKNYLFTNENGYTTFMLCNKSSSKNKVHNDKFLPQEIRKISNEQLNFTPTGGKEAQS